MGFKVQGSKFYVQGSGVRGFGVRVSPLRHESFRLRSSRCDGTRRRAGSGALDKKTAGFIEKETVKSKGSKLKAEGSKLVGWALPTNHLKPETFYRVVSYKPGRWLKGSQSDQ
jgi:hypothetical protein